MRVGPVAYANWNAMLTRNEPPTEGFEALLYSDAAATGGHWELGPYSILNTIAGAAKMRGATVSPLLLRVMTHLPHDQWLPSGTSTNTAGYHGGDLSDEIAVLLALLTRRRLRAGGPTRYFRNSNDRGDPRADVGVDAPVVPQSGRLLPRQAQTIQLLDAGRDLLATYPTLPPALAVALVRSARSYRDAIWIGETEPALAWLLLVSSIECAANAAAIQARTDRLDLLRRNRQRLVKRLTRVGASEEVVRVVADEVADLFGASDKFLSFIERYGPNAGPQPRPPYGELPWDDADAMREALSLVYVLANALVEGSRAEIEHAA